MVYLSKKGQKKGMLKAKRNGKKKSCGFVWVGFLGGGGVLRYVDGRMME